jgi:hypothetical protein
MAAKNGTTKEAKQEVEKRPVGRPSLFKPEYCEQARKLCLLGSTDDELAAFFEVNPDTIHEWKKVHPNFSESIKDGKEYADAQVAERLFKRAMGYEHSAVKIVADAKTGAEHIVEYTERYPPDSTAAIFWLKNRQKGKWRDKTDTEITGKDGGSVKIETKTSVTIDPATAYLELIGKK